MLSDEARGYLVSNNAVGKTPIERLEVLNSKAIDVYARQNIDIYTQKLRIAVCAQHNNGGIAVDMWWQTSVSGLFAAGEAMWFGVLTKKGSDVLSKIFGELFMLIENDKRGNSLQLLYSDEKFNVPSNVYIIGMMNTADRSLAMIDYALRRRFSFFEVAPAFKRQKFIDHLSNLIGDTSVVSMVNDRLYALNEIIADEDKSGLGKGFCIGHSYFCTKPTEGQTPMAWYKSIIKFEISPLLDEYWWDDKDKAAECKKELMGE